MAEVMEANPTAARSYQNPRWEHSHGTHTTNSNQLILLHIENMPVSDQIVHHPACTKCLAHFRVRYS